MHTGRRRDVSLLTRTATNHSVATSNEVSWLQPSKQYTVSMKILCKNQILVPENRLLNGKDFDLNHILKKPIFKWKIISFNRLDFQTNNFSVDYQHLQTKQFRKFRTF